jgi:hypothetical protein
MRCPAQDIILKDYGEIVPSGAVGPYGGWSARELATGREAIWFPSSLNPIGIGIKINEAPLSAERIVALVERSQTKPSCFGRAKSLEHAAGPVV